MTNQAIGRQTICIGKLIFLWSVYGYAMASLTAAVRAAGGSDAIGWSVALVAGLALAAALRQA